MNFSVITGVSFRKYKGIVYIQIQQGILVGGGNINESTVQWKEIPDGSLFNYF